jgi:hypothetical protein
MRTTYLHAKFSMPKSSGPLVTTIKPKAKYRCHNLSYCCIIFHKKKVHLQKLHIFERHITYAISEPPITNIASTSEVRAPVVVLLLTAGN